MTNKEIANHLGVLLMNKGGTEELGITSKADEINDLKLRVKPDFVLGSSKYPDTILLMYGEQADRVNETKNKIVIDSTIISEKYNFVALVESLNPTILDGYNTAALICKKEFRAIEYNIGNVKNINSIENIFKLTDKYVEQKFDTQAVATTLWGCADTLRGAYKPHEYGETVLPLVIIKRLSDTFEEKYEEFWEEFKTFDETIDIEKRYAMAMNNIDITYCNVTGSRLRDCISESYSAADGFQEYIENFRDASGTGIVEKILGYMDIDHVIDKLREVGKAHALLSEIFGDKVYLGSSTSASDMGYIFEHLIHKFNEAVGQGAGEHYTAPDIVKTMADILLNTVEIDTEKETATAYDMAMGTSQMLTVLSTKFTEKYGEDADISLYGQELNGFTYAIACADALVRGVNPITINENLHHGDTLSDDQLPGKKFNYVISNPPFGVKWENEYDEVAAESQGYGANRFPWGLPAKSDGQMLFTCNGASKLAPNGAMAIIHNGSPLFSGNAGSGESTIRGGIISNDGLIAIIKLPNDMFYNTGIGTYIWVVGLHKKENRVGKVQLIDASKCCKKSRKSNGSKRNEIDDDCRNAIVQAYIDFKDNEIYVVDEDKEIQCESKIFDNEYFRGEPDNKNRYKWEIPFDKLFYKAEEQENSEGIKLRILKLNSKIQSGMQALFGEDLNTTHEQSDIPKQIDGQEEIEL